MVKRNGMGRLVLFVVALLVTGLSCQALTGAPTEPEGPAPTPVSQETVAAQDAEPTSPPEVVTEAPPPSPTPDEPATVAPEATETTAATPTAVEAAEGTLFEAEEIAFSYPPALASEVVVEEVPASDPGEESPPFAIYPAHRVFYLEGYPLEDTFQPPRVIVLPAQEYAAMNEWAAEEIDALAQRLAEQQASFPATEPLPYLPDMGAAQVLHAQEAYVPFQNGSGLRYVTAFAQDVWPITNEAIFYTYQGLSADGATYVSVILPVRTDALPDTVDVDDFDYEEFAANYDEYQRETQAQLNELEPDAFTPSLELLDSFVQSLRAGGE